MDRLKKLIRESLVAHLNEADSKKKDDVIVPEGCFGGPKHNIGALVNIVELLMLEKDENGNPIPELVTATPIGLLNLAAVP